MNYKEDIANSTDTYIAQNSPKTPRDTELLAKFERLHQLKAQGISYNESLVSKREFRNPAMYNKIVTSLGIKETGSNMSSANYRFDEDMFADQLRKRQQAHEEKRVAQFKTRKEIAFVSKKGSI